MLSVIHLDVPLVMAPSNLLMASLAKAGVAYSTVAMPVDRPERSYWSLRVSVIHLVSLTCKQKAKTQ